MDWFSKEGRALLRQAFPAGYFAGRGVFTLGRYQCEGRTGLSRAFSTGCAPVKARADFGSTGIPVNNVQAPIFADVLAAGDLLPLPDPEDVATWACLLAELARRQGVVDRPYEPNTGWAWTQGPNDGKRLPGEPPYWTLVVTSGQGWVSRNIHDLPQSDPAEALVAALIQGREQLVHPC